MVQKITNDFFLHDIMILDDISFVVKKYLIKFIFKIIKFKLNKET